MQTFHCRVPTYYAIHRRNLQIIWVLPYDAGKYNTITDYDLWVTHSLGLMVLVSITSEPPLVHIVITCKIPHVLGMEKHDKAQHNSLTMLSVIEAPNVIFICSRTATQLNNIIHVKFHACFWPREVSEHLAQLLSHAFSHQRIESHCNLF